MLEPAAKARPARRAPSRDDLFRGLGETVDSVTSLEAPHVLDEVFLVRDASKPRARLAARSAHPDAPDAPTAGPPREP